MREEGGKREEIMRSEVRVMREEGEGRWQSYEVRGMELVACDPLWVVRLLFRSRKHDL